MKFDYPAVFPAQSRLPLRAVCRKLSRDV